MFHDLTSINKLTSALVTIGWNGLKSSILLLAQPPPLEEVYYTSERILVLEEHVHFKNGTLDPTQLLWLIVYNGLLKNSY